jgi:hypothetical protein
MSQVLEKAIASYQNRTGVLYVANPKVGQRVTILARDESRCFVPCLATVRRVFKSKVLADLYTDKSVPYYALRENVWTWAEPAPGSWHATRDGEPFKS